MRAIAEQEYARVFGGNSNQDPTVLPTTTVTATPLPPYGNGGFDMWTVGGEYGGGSPIDANNAQNDVDHVDGSDPFNDGQDADGNVSEQEFENALKAALEMAEKGALDTELAHKLFVSVEYADMAAHVGKLQFTEGEISFKSFETYGNNSYEIPGQFNMVHWDRVDWSQYDNDGKATAIQAMTNLMHDVNVNHHAYLTSESTWSS